MKQMKKDVKSITKELRALTQKTEKIIKTLEKLDKPQAKSKPVKKAAKPKRAIKKAAVKKTAKKATTSKSAKGTVVDAVMGVIQANSKGVNTDQIMKQTGLNKKQVRGTIDRAKREGKIKTVKRGVYVGV